MPVALSLELDDCLGSFQPRPFYDENGEGLEGFCT